MADIVEFRVKPKQPPLPATRRKRRSAEVVIFPGVRYERWAEDQTAKAAPQGPQRDRLVLVD